MPSCQTPRALMGLIMPDRAKSYGAVAWKCYYRTLVSRLETLRLDQASSKRMNDASIQWDSGWKHFFWPVDDLSK